MSHEACTQPAPRRAVMIDGCLVLAQQQDDGLVSANCLAHNGLHNAVLTHHPRAEDAVIKAIAIVRLRCPINTEVVVHVSQGAMKELIDALKTYNPDPAYFAEVERAAAEKYRQLAVED